MGGSLTELSPTVLNEAQAKNPYLWPGYSGMVIPNDIDIWAICIQFSTTDFFNFSSVVDVTMTN
jgi:hypothetical protein